MTFRSGLEEKVADLLVSLGVDYEYEETSYPYTIQHQYTPDFVLPDNGVILEVKGYWDHHLGVRLDKSSRTIPT